MKINRITLFSILLIALVLLSTFESKPTKNKKSKAKSKARLNRMASEITSTVETKGLDWKNDPFLRELKDEQKYIKTANTEKKWFLIKMIIGKVVSLLGVKTEDVFAGLKLLDDKKKLDAFEIIKKFHKSMDLDDLRPIATKYKWKGLTETKFVPENRTFLLNFLNCHIRQN